MVNTIDMQDLRHLNLFGQITKISTRFCFTYNGMIFFCVPRSLVSRAVGKNGENVKKMNEILGKRIRIISQPNGTGEVKRFIESIVTPVTFNGVEFSGNEIIINSGNTQNKAALMGRHKKRLMELGKIVKDYFNKELKIA